MRSRLLVGVLLLLLLGAPSAPSMDLGLPENYRLLNGLRLVTLREGSLPLVGMALVVPAGSSTETPATNGYGHVLADLWENLRYSPEAEEIKLKLEEQGARWSTRFDEHTVEGMLTLPAEEWGQALELAAIWSRMTSISPASLEESRSRVLRKLAKKVRFPREQGLLDDRLRALAYSGHPLGLAADGSEEAVRGVTVEKLAAHLQERLLPNQAVLALVGDLPGLDPLLERSMELFRRPAGTGFAPLARAKELPGSEVREPAEVDRTVASVGFRVPGVEHEDFPALALIQRLLGRGSNSLLERRLVNQEGLLASVSSRLSRLPGDNLLHFELDSVDTRIDVAIRGLFQVCAGLARTPPDGDGLENVRQGVKTAQALRAQKRSSRAHRLARAELFGKSDLVLEMPERLDSVTPAELARVAGRYLRPERAHIVVLHPRGADQEASEGILWRRFTGGIDVVLDQDRSSEVVGLSMAFPGGAGIQPADKPGLSALLEHYLAAAGTRLEPKGETERRLQRHGTDIRAVTGGIWGSAVGLTATVYGFEELLSTLQASVLHPRWDQETFRRVREEVRESWRYVAERPHDFGIWRVFQALYPSGSHVPAAGKIWEQLEGYTLEDIQALHEDLVQRAHWVVGVTGNLCPTKVLRTVARTFEVEEIGPGARGRQPPPSEFRGEPKIRLEVESISAGYDALWVGLQIPGAAIKDLAPLTVWFNLLGFRGDSLFKQELRKLDPSAETISQLVMVPPAGGAMIFGFRLETGTGRKAAQRLQEILEGLPEMAVDQARVQQTARRIRTALLIGSQEKFSQASSLASDTQQAEWPTVQRDLIQSYSGLTVPEVKRVARENLRSGVVLLFEGK